MNIGIYGGTFDPIHKGHTRLLAQAEAVCGLEKVIIMPDRIPPHKQRSDIAPAEDRLKMCRLALADDPAVLVSDWEKRQEGKSYSVLTLRHLREVFPEDRLWFIMGSDMLTSFHKWYRYEEILELSGLICMTRYEGDDEQLEAAAKALRQKGGVVELLPAHAFEVSSSQIRAALERGDEEIPELDERGLGYIRSKGLYRKHEG